MLVHPILRRPFIAWQSLHGVNWLMPSLWTSHGYPSHWGHCSFQFVRLALDNWELIIEPPPFLPTGNMKSRNRALPPFRSVSLIDNCLTGIFSPYGYGWEHWSSVAHLSLYVCIMTKALASEGWFSNNKCHFDVLFEAETRFVAHLYSLFWKLQKSQVEANTIE